MSTGPWFIYALVDPRDDAVRYVGRTNNVAMRVRGHQSQKSNNTRKCAWLAELRAAGLKVKARVLEEQAAWVAAKEAEASWIRKGCALGWPLFNSPQVGVGSVNGRPRGLPCDAGNCDRPILCRGFCAIHWYEVAKKEGLAMLFSREVLRRHGVQI